MNETTWNAALIARNGDVETVSAYTDWLQERGDPRGLDYASCLRGETTGEALMREHPSDVGAMWVAAWVVENMGRCHRCRGSGRVWIYLGHGDMREDECWDCGSEGLDFDQKQCDRAEALRLLAECGKVGEQNDGISLWSYWSREDCRPAGRVPDTWLRPALGAMSMRGETISIVGERLALMDAYADATDAARDRWQAETLALTPVTAVS